jgi:AcrR family transcriptional regulator
MPRSGKVARERLQQAALELYRDQGYDQTTTAQIAARAGVTERTFFRHFADKREVVFDEDALRETFAAGMAGAPAKLRPLDALFWTFRSAEPLLEKHRPLSELRRRIVLATPALQERFLAKEAVLINDLATALQRRGVDRHLARLAAQIGMAACGRAVQAWMEKPSTHFARHLERAFKDLHKLF